MFSLLSKFLTLKLIDDASIKAERLIFRVEESATNIIVSFVAFYAASIFFVIGVLIFLSALFMYLFGFFDGVVPALWTGLASLVVSLLIFFVAKGRMSSDG